ncbi:HNH endonuclease [Persephonella hydrogeniphila]|uniref:HNH endonuclease n=1 Tax=Persephonella hydrogeniphila TaxID=198703 RepID=A0A285NBS8_9AQUI|nr:HNH endonuclease domain-containing protein [Persephonella hydrogeniphila]SNZ06915.1 HNH endonuclease [Persephonella hydrogeniphila]
MNFENFKTVNFIIERDSKDTIYKFALLRAAIETVQEFDHLKTETENKVSFPLGILIQKWIFYYYPLLEYEIPQKHGNNNLAFRSQLKKIINYYQDKGGINALYSDLKRGTVPEEIKNDFLNLLKKLKETITNMPMRYLGKSYFGKDYSVFQYNKDSKRLNSLDKIDQHFLIENFGTFSISKEIYITFLYLGSFINGTESILYKWAEFSVRADKEGKFTVEKVLDRLLISPEDERDVLFAQKAYKKLLHKNKELECVWSGKRIKKESTLNVDHAIPFSIWKNNDLWNLLPAHREINQIKKDKIPSPRLITKREKVIKFYWKILENEYKDKFRKEIITDLIGFEKGESNIKEILDNGIMQLQLKAKYLIEVRGYEEWYI